MSAGWLAIPAVVCVSSAVYQWLGTVLITRWLGEKTSAPEELPPVTLLRPLKPGVPDLRGKLERLAQALRPEDQLILGAVPGSAEWQASLELQRNFPAREIAAISCREDAALNPKISKLVQMEAVCRHERLILSDSEALIDTAWLDGFRSEWEAYGTDVLTTGYRFVGMRSWPQRFDAVPTLVSLWPGLAVVRRWGWVNFTLGACTGLRRSDLVEVGGWQAFGDFLAEDRELGAVLAARGRTIRLAATVTTLDSDPLTWRDWWRHQCRVAVTYRVCTPGGFAGTLITHGATAAILLALGSLTNEENRWGLVWAALFFIVRWLAARQLAKALNFPIPSLGISMLAGGLAETAAWALSWFPSRIWWSARWWRVGKRGKLAPNAPASSIR